MTIEGVVFDDPGRSGEILPKTIVGGDEVSVWKPWMSLGGYDHGAGDLSERSSNQEGETRLDEALLCTRFCIALRNSPAGTARYG